MLKTFQLFGFLLLTSHLSGQFVFQGVAPAEYHGEVVYLDILDGWNDFDLISDKQPLQRGKIDSTGRYRIAGEGLPPRQGFYRLRFRDRDEPPVSMDFSRRHVIHFIAGPGDSLSFAGLELHNPDATNAAIARLALRLDALDAEEMHAETPRLQLLIDNKRREMLGNLLPGKDVAVDLFVLGNWPDETVPLALMHDLETALVQSDLRPGYLKSLRADIGAFDVAGSRARAQKLKWWLGISLLLNALLLLLWWRGRRMQGKVVEAQRIPVVELTPREEEVLGWIAEGQSNKEIAAHLFVSQDTVKSHINSIYKKAGISNRREAKAWHKARETSN